MSKFAATLGAVGGVPLALLINRYLLGNTSNTSKWIAAALGGLGGAATGWGVNKYLEGQALKQMQGDISTNVAANKRLVNQYRDSISGLNSAISAAEKDLTDEQTTNAVDYWNKFTESDVYKQLTPEGQNQLRAAYLEQLAQLKSVQAAQDEIGRTFDPMSTAIDEPLMQLSDAAKQELFDYAQQFASKGIDIDRHIAYGGLRPGWFDKDDKKLQEMYGILSTKLLPHFGGNRYRMNAVMAYHNILPEIASNIMHNPKLPEQYKNPLVIDYLAVSAMPQKLRENLPVTHRIDSITRAGLSRGWSYNIDRQMLIDPNYLSEALNLTSGAELAQDVGYSATSLLTAKLPWVGNLAANLTTTFGVDALQGQLGSPTNIMPWHPKYDRNGLWSGMWDGSGSARSKAIDLLSGQTRVLVPQYSFMLPTTQRHAKARAMSSMLANAVDMGVDIKNSPGLLNIGLSTGFNGVPMYGDFNTLLNTKIPTLEQNTDYNFRVSQHHAPKDVDLTKIIMSALLKNYSGKHYNNSYKYLDSALK